ncbi:cytidylate kinase [Caldicellulosiruptor bescii]|uniref:Cytidylate kinase n=2 Tax=Caldicellulosiruptor bescii TaxID=31899 RepID=KCY_CALBD|nr:(d)CMP kinase [Caldicellulosiruptor bescii]B9MRX1.1 RecName: Full=Cytidylate kinase; Short=CK; AltName: Full=Cytidine monophosphate kinase; Short=CMP kinase [Caldicellulosiruptor bescii DSM 6725]ACM60425.1 cytidylate kinase [Caldicellulosiruptor bescii DSM 6725]PBC87839.1 cytidylate kinase [Caldicellulosiruptor bescii]PBC90771.1 cytidylate kinase [Caldicellulosiruptor bescii]PBD03796.1 cytidylate kinase [Caldicellulosiruptor bescii]PBD06569.1 cytidylate kinase [Caldicellulosiruptor bescii]
MKKINIAIDGPAGAGKSTISKLLASQLGYIHIDTGAMYRAVGLKVLKNNISPHDRKKIVEILNSTDIQIKLVDGRQLVFLDGEDVTEKIRQPEVSMYASDVSKIREVRERLVKMQQELAKQKGVIMDGRDIGTHVLPNAELKIFLTATAEERAKRRFLELKQKGYDVDYYQLLDEIKKRDQNDMTREFAPLRVAEDAIVIDSTSLSIEEVLQKVLELFYKVVKNEV